MTSPTTDEPSETDRNGDPLVGRILDIIDAKRSRYLVACAIAEDIRASNAQLIATILEDGPKDPKHRDYCDLMSTRHYSNPEDINCSCDYDGINENNAAWRSHITKVGEGLK
jgi:hypothetical protein